MIKRIRVICGLLLLAVFCQCHQQPRVPQDPILGYYELTGYDLSGALAFRGNIRLNSYEQSYLNGHCKVVREVKAPEGVYDKDGPCQASLKGKAITIDLAPNLFDGGVLFEGELENGKITGVWLLGGFVGSDAKGRILAVKRKN